MKMRFLALICFVILTACGGGGSNLSTLQANLNTVAVGTGPSFTDSSATDVEINQQAEDILSQLFMICFGSAEEVNNTFDFSSVAPGSSFNFSVTALSIPGTISGDVKIDAQVNGTLVNANEGSETMTLQMLLTNFSLNSGLTLDGDMDCDYTLQANSTQQTTTLHPVGAVAFSGTYGGKASAELNYNIVEPTGGGSSTGSASGEILLVSGEDTYSCPFAFDSSSASTDIFCSKI